MNYDKLCKHLLNKGWYYLDKDRHEITNPQKDTDWWVIEEKILTKFPNRCIGNACNISYNTKLLYILGIL
jgi:hypothetical protein